MKQIEMDFTSTVHVRENSAENERHLNENRQKFTGQCAIVLSLLQAGHVLSTRSAMVQWNIGHLARRIKDLRDNPKTPVLINEAWEKDRSGRATRNKLWFMIDRVSEENKRKYGI